MSEILEFAINFTRKNKVYPTLIDLARAGHTRAAVREEFYNLETLLIEVAKEVDDILFDLNRHKVNTTPSKKKRFVITTAVIGADLNSEFYQSIKTYCKRNDAELNILISVNKATGHQILPLTLKEEKFVLSDTELNTNLFILGIRNSAAQADPITGLPRIGQRNGTFICPSPKQRLKFVATGPNRLPHAIMSTGAITKPNYIKSQLMVAKSAYMADNDHVMGAVIVELDKGGVFHFRQIQSDEKGGFVDLGRYYRKNKITKMAPSAFVLGDWHSGETDVDAVKAWLAVTDMVTPKSWIIHDGFSGNSISHHTVGKNIVKAKMAKHNELSLEKELNGYCKDLDMMVDKVGKVVIVKSNHDDFLDRYLDEGRYIADHENHRLALELATASIDGMDPLRYYYETIFKSKKAKNIQWLERDEDYSIAGIQLGAHGDKGANGARGSAVSLEAAYGNCVFGHSHTPEILRGAWCVGTTSKLKLSYNVGASSWFHTSCLVYPNGQRQLINSIDGKFTA